MIRRQPAYSIRARDLASHTQAGCMAAIYSCDSIPKGNAWHKGASMYALNSVSRLVLSNGEVTRLGLNRDPSQFGKLVYASFAAKSTIAGRAHSTEGHLRLVVDGGTVDMADSGTNLACHAQATGRIAGEHGGRQAIVTVIGETYGVRFIFGANDSHHGAEAFIAIDAHCLGN